MWPKFAALSAPVAPMPHVAFVPFTGFRIREQQMLELGMSLPGLQRRAAAIAELPALGLLTLAGMTPDRWSVSYHGAESWSEELVVTVLDERPTLVAISALTASVEEAYQFSQRIREAGIPTVIGGLHATTCPDEAGQFADAVVIGEGEGVWLQVLADAETKSLKAKYRSSRETGPAPWPLPRLELLGPRPPRLTLQTQRGCPLACEFCGASRLLGPFREKPAGAIRRELEAIRSICPRPLLELADDNTFAGGRDAEELLKVLGDFDVRWFTEADWRIGERPELLARLAAAGCVQVLIGIESLVFRYPGMGDKRAELDRIMTAIEAVQDAGVAVNGCFIVGADGETHASLDRLVQFILDSSLAEVQVTLQTPFPGTGLHRRLWHQGRLLADRGWSYYTLFDVTFQPDALTVEELELGFERVLRQVFSSEASRRRQEIRRDIWRRNPRLHS
jgi:radical SAM superfamily enzyme YgiQ (UPF0313 family)